MPTISVIIPVYNVERYLRRCLDSVLAQTFTDWECIIVDDGSPDGCPAICDEYADRDGRLLVIHKSRNEGLPAARKTGLDAAFGEFVFHLDSDDWIEADALEVLYQKQRKTGADVVMGGHRQIHPGYSRDYYPAKVDGQENGLVYFFLRVPSYLWGKLYRASLFADYSVPGFNSGEDLAVNAQIFSHLSVSRLAVQRKVIYNYDCRSAGSIVRREEWRTLRGHASYASLLWVEDYLKQSNAGADVTAAFGYKVTASYIISYVKQAKKIDPKEFREFYKKYVTGCWYRNRIRPAYRALLRALVLSLPLGYVYRWLLNGAIFFANRIRRRHR